MDFSNIQREKIIMNTKIQKLRLREAEALSNLIKTFNTPQFRLMSKYLTATNKANQEVLSSL